MRMATIISQTDKRSGITYAYESISFWDKEKKQSRSKRTLIGRVDEETGEIVPTDGRMKKAKEKEIPISTRKTRRLFYGATYLLDKISEEVGIEKDLKSCFPNTYKHILSLAYYLVLEPDSPLYRFDKWDKLHKHPYGKNISSERSTSVLSSISEDGKNKFFKLQGKRRIEKEFNAYDTTSISSNSEILKHVVYGKNKENDDLPQLNLALLYGEESMLPFYYRKLPGNMSDMKIVSSLLAELDVLGFTNVKLVMDRGFFREKNVNEMFKRRAKFLMGVKMNLKFIQEVFEEVRSEIKTFENYNENYGLYGYTVRTNWQYKQERKGIERVENRRIYIHFYFDIQRAADDEVKLDKKLSQLYNDLVTDQRKPSKVKQYEKYFSIKTTPKRGTKAVLKDEVVALEKQQLGYFALVSNVTLKAPEAIDIYRTKDVVEKAFGNLKERLEMRRMHVSTEETLEGKIFVQFVALIFYSFIKKRLKNTGFSKKYTVQQLLDQLELIECFEAPGHKTSVSELSQKQSDIFEAFGIEPPSSL